MRRTLVSNESIDEAHCVNITVYCSQVWTSRKVPILSNRSTATSSSSGAQSDGAVTVGAAPA